MKFGGKLKLLNTPSGQIAKSLIKDGVNIGISSRALGSVREENRSKYCRSRSSTYSI